MNEVKRYDFNLCSQCNEEPDNNGRYVLTTDFESERALRIEAETKLHELQDAIEVARYSVTTESLRIARKVLVQAIQESRKRREAK